MLTLCNIEQAWDGWRENKGYDNEGDADQGVDAKRRRNDLTAPIIVSQCIALGHELSKRCSDPEIGEGPDSDD